MNSATDQPGTQVATGVSEPTGTLEVALAHAEELLQYTYNAVKTQAASGQNTFLIPPTSPNFLPLIDVLQRQSIQIGALASPVT